jgi:hypothetical protein
MPDRSSEQHWRAQRLRKAESAIQKIITDLYTEDFIRVEHVRIDTREWSYGSVTLLTADDLDPEPTP